VTIKVRPHTAEGVNVQILTGAEALVKGLERLGVEVVFGLCGHTNLAMLDALTRSPIDFYAVRHEQIAAHAADGYYRATHKPAAVLTTIGPGMTNALTGVGDASLDGSAMIVICGDVPSYMIGRDAFQETNLHGDAQQYEIYRPLVKRAWRVPNREAIVYDLMRAYSHSVTGKPGPVLLDVPMDLFSESSVQEIPDITKRLPTSTRSPGNVSEIEDATRLLVAAQRPVIFAGGGAVQSEAQAEVTALADYLGIPVVTTMSGQGAISQDHLLSAGYAATVGVPFAHQLINTADVVLVLGSELSEMDTSSWNPEFSFRVPPTRLIQIDIEPTQIGKSYPVEVGIIADVRTAVRQILDVARSTTGTRDWRSEEWFKELRAQIDGWEEEIAQQARSDAQPIGVERLLADIRTALPRDGIFLTDVGIRHNVAQQFPVYEQMTHYVGSGWGTMGGAVAAALGAKIGRPERAVVAEVGDGAFSSIMAAIITAVEYDLGITWVVMNNFGYSSISVYQKKHGLGDLGTTFRTLGGQQTNPDFAEIARACGAQGRRIENPRDLGPALKEAIASNKPWVLDVLTEAAPRSRASGYWDVNDILSGERFRQ
jgi:acetolactate synthase-1/2/3 large subunit